MQQKRIDPWGHGVGLRRERWQRCRRTYAVVQGIRNGRSGRVAGSDAPEGELRLMVAWLQFGGCGSLSRRQEKPAQDWEERQT